MASSLRRTSQSVQRPIELGDYNPSQQSAVLALLNALASQESTRFSELKAVRDARIQVLQTQIAEATRELDELKSQSDSGTSDGASGASGAELKNIQRMQTILMRNYPEPASRVFCRARNQNRYDCTSAGIQEMIKQPEPYAFYYVHPKDLKALLAQDWNGFAGLIED
jgi:hypothetical protein